MSRKMDVKRLEFSIIFLVSYMLLGKNNEKSFDDNLSNFLSFLS